MFFKQDIMLILPLISREAIGSVDLEEGKTNTISTHDRLRRIFIMVCGHLILVSSLTEWKAGF
jgi:hypothetical protein